MDEKRYEGLLFADISANDPIQPYRRTADNRSTTRRLARAFGERQRLSLPAINALIRTGALVKQGYITNEERTCINEIYDYNPLLFDFVLKRRLRLPGTRERLPAAIFMANAALEKRTEWEQNDNPPV